MRRGPHPWETVHAEADAEAEVGSRMPEQQFPLVEAPVYPPAAKRDSQRRSCFVCVDSSGLRGRQQVLGAPKCEGSELDEIRLALSLAG